MTLTRVARWRPEPVRSDGDWAALLLAALLMSPLGWNYYLWIAVWPTAALLAHHAPWRQPARWDLWLLPGLGGWLWWGKMTAWGQPHVAGHAHRCLAVFLGAAGALDLDDRARLRRAS